MSVFEYTHRIFITIIHVVVNFGAEIDGNLPLESEIPRICPVQRIEISRYVGPAILCPRPRPVVKGGALIYILSSGLPLFNIENITSTASREGFVVDMVISVYF